MVTIPAGAPDLEWDMTHTSGALSGQIDSWDSGAWVPCR